MHFFKDKFKGIPRHIWILAAITLLGLFLRSYNFHDWLDFGSDQVNDATRAGIVVEGTAPWPSYGPDMGNSGVGGRSNRFKLGPLYYYFEIVSAKIFGNDPVSMAYPDLLFSVLSIPLLFFFLKRLFSINLALVLVGLYSISFYSLSFSHSAWNVNSIPFFSLLFLLALHELITDKEKTRWKWIVSLGVALGAGIQLHAILLVLFPAMSFFTWLIFLRKEPKTWRKIGAACAIAAVLNLGQIVSEQKNGYLNTRIFFSSATGSSVNSDKSVLGNAVDDLNCNAQANTYMLSAVGDGMCNPSLASALTGEGNKRIFREIKKPLFIAEAFAILLFSAAGYGLMLYVCIRDADKKRKYFLGLLLIYATLSFFIMLPIIDAALRYFNHTFFIPLIFIGLFFNKIEKKFSQQYFIGTAAAIVLIFSATNIYSTWLQVNSEFAGTRIILGQVESMVTYMDERNGRSGEAYLMGNASSNNFFKSLCYVASKKNISLMKVLGVSEVPAGKPLFYLDGKSDAEIGPTIDGNSYNSYEKFGRAMLYDITN